jgi:hypothetical protein
MSVAALGVATEPTLYVGNSLRSHVRGASPAAVAARAKGEGSRAKGLRRDEQSAA